MSLEDLFGSDLEDSEDEERGKSNTEASRKAQLDELFGDSPSEEEADHEEREQSEGRSARDSASGQESDRSDEREKQEENDEEDTKVSSTILMLLLKPSSAIRQLIDICH